MRFARQARCVCTASRFARVKPGAPRSFQTSARQRDEDRPSNSKPKGETTNAAMDVRKAYTPEQRKKLEKRYTPEQLAALEIGEEAVDPKDIIDKGALRNDPMSLSYLDDFSAVRPYIDHRAMSENRSFDPKAIQFKDDGDISMDFLEEAGEAKGSPATVLQRVFDKGGFIKGNSPAAEDVITQAPLPKLRDPLIRRTVRQGRTESGSELDRFYAQLSKQVGLKPIQLRTLRIKILEGHHVANQTRMGKIRKHWVLMVAGNKKGLLGIGEGSASEYEQAVMKARRNAIRSMVPIPRYERRTIYGDVKGKVGATELELFTRPPGFGLRCQEKIHEMCKCAGISDLSARVTRARNPMNTIKAAFQALLKQRDPEQVARGRGRKMVDVRKVYYAGMT